MDLDMKEKRKTMFCSFFLLKKRIEESNKDRNLNQAGWNEEIQMLHSASPEPTLLHKLKCLQMREKSVERLQFNKHLPSAAHSHQTVLKRLSSACSVNDIFLKWPLCVLRGTYVKEAESVFKEYHPRVLFSCSSQPLTALPKPLKLEYCPCTDHSPQKVSLHPITSDPRGHVIWILAVAEGQNSSWMPADDVTQPHSLNVSSHTVLCYGSLRGTFF